MRTTLDLDDRILRQAKKQAAADGTTLTRLIEQALREYLTPSSRPARAYRFEPLVKSGRILPGVDVADRDTLYERMEGRG